MRCRGGIEKEKGNLLVINKEKGASDICWQEKERKKFSYKGKGKREKYGALMSDWNSETYDFVNR